MIPKLLLTSQGIPKELKAVFLSLLAKPPEEIKLAFVTTAAYGDYDNPTWLEVYRKQLRGYGITKTEDLDIRNKNKEELGEIVRDKDIILVNGGNTFFLLKWMRKSGFDSIVRKHIKKGKLYIGISAGSYIACPTIEQGLWNQKFRDIKTFGMKNLRGLNLVPFWIVAHFEEKWRKDIEIAAKRTKYPIIALNDTQAVLIEGKKWGVVGKGKKVIFNSDKIQ
ncbi:Type 1 glutamine amidotransferase-like domain-containing protein [Candidatus Roizmanbacteria bacterium]|nr:Type 1 glutamine amidotransferase-like domain-containing protein [Candidatus Roizmanbacteria bacterium]